MSSCAPLKLTRLHTLLQSQQDHSCLRALCVVSSRNAKYVAEEHADIWVVSEQAARCLFFFVELGSLRSHNRLCAVTADWRLLCQRCGEVNAASDILRCLWAAACITGEQQVRLAFSL